jgi:4-amino-4-deoxy-L-arabinose transferase-like glycosyltransferase
MARPKSRRATNFPAMTRLTSKRATWLAILALALVLRLAAAAWWQSRLPPGRHFFFGDSDAYWQLGRAIARGDDYQLTPETRVLRAPGYPILLAGVFVIRGDDAPVMAGRVLGALLGTIAVGIAGWWASTLFDARAGLWAGWITALYPGAVSMGSFILTEAPFTPLMLAHLALWGMAWRATSVQQASTWGAGAGIAAAMATLVRPSWILFAPLALVLALVFDSRRVRQLAIAVTMAATFALCMLPWWIRNARVTGRFVPTTLQVGASLYDGINPRATGASDMSFVPGFTAAEHAGDATAPADEIFEYRLDRRLFDEAVAWARANPARVTELAWIKFTRIWNVWPNEPSLRSWPLRLTIAATYVPLLCLGLVGAWRYSRWGWPYVLAWLPAVYITLLHVVFVSSIRYREPPMMALIVLAAGVLAGASHAPPQGAAAYEPTRKG